MPAAVCRLSELPLQSSLREPRKVLRNSVFDCASHHALIDAAQFIGIGFAPACCPWPAKCTRIGFNAATPQ